MIFDITEFTGIFLPFAIEKTGVIHDKIRDIIGDLTALTLIILINSWRCFDIDGITQDTADFAAIPD